MKAGAVPGNIGGRMTAMSNRERHRDADRDEMSERIDCDDQKFQRCAFATRKSRNT